MKLAAARQSPRSRVRLRRAVSSCWRARKPLQSRDGIGSVPGSSDGRVPVGVRSRRRSARQRLAARAARRHPQAHRARSARRGHRRAGGVYVHQSDHELPAGAGPAGAAARQPPHLHPARRGVWTLHPGGAHHGRRLLAAVPDVPDLARHLANRGAERQAVCRAVRR